MFRAAMHDDPFFFDAIGFMRLADDDDGVFPRPTGEAVNFFRPSEHLGNHRRDTDRRAARFNRSADHSGVDADDQCQGSTSRSKRRPFLNQFAIPPLPLNDKTQTDHRTAFNLGSPMSDFRSFAMTWLRCSPVFGEIRPIARVHWSTGFCWVMSSHSTRRLHGNRREADFRMAGGCAMMSRISCWTCSAEVACRATTFRTTMAIESRMVRSVRTARRGRRPSRTSERRIRPLF